LQDSLRPYVVERRKTVGASLGTVKPHLLQDHDERSSARINR
jgi:hypothetical protein